MDLRLTGPVVALAVGPVVVPVTVVHRGDHTPDDGSGVNQLDAARQALRMQTVAREETGSYGIVSAEPHGDRISKMTGIVEKPQPEDAPSTLGVVGRYILSPRIFHFLENLRRGAGGEIQLTDAIARLLREEGVYAYEFQGQRYDCGSKLGYLQATVNLGLKHPQLAKEFREFLNGVVTPNVGKGA